MRIETVCDACHKWLPIQTPMDLCLDCRGFICPACRPTHTERRHGDDTFLTCQPHTDEEVARMFEGEA